MFSGSFICFIRLDWHRLSDANSTFSGAGGDELRSKFAISSMKQQASPPPA
jgi:hypothetical protein